MQGITALRFDGPIFPPTMEVPMNMRLVSSAFACVMVLCPAVAVLGQPGSAQDKHFVRHSMQDDNSEVQLAHLVLQKTKSADVKQFAQRIRMLALPGSAAEDRMRIS